MKSNRIVSYMVITLICTIVCLAIAAYLLFENAVFYGSVYADIHRPLVALFAGVALFRVFCLLYRLKLISKPIFLTILVVGLFSIFYAVLLYSFSALYSYTIVNESFWNNPIPYSSFFKDEFHLFINHFRSYYSNWALPTAVYMAVSCLYLVLHNTRMGRRANREVIEVIYSSPFLESAEDDAKGQSDTEDDSINWLIEIIDERIERAFCCKERLLEKDTKTNGGEKDEV